MDPKDIRVPLSGSPLATHPKSTREKDQMRNNGKGKLTTFCRFIY